MDNMKCLTGDARTAADALLDAIAADGRLEFLCTNEDRDFIANCQKTRHIHWPVAWLGILRNIATTLEID